MSSAEQVADAILQIARGDRTEIALPATSGRLLNLLYLFPWLRRKIRPLLHEKGRKNKEKYRNRE